MKSNYKVVCLTMMFAMVFLLCSTILVADEIKITHKPFVLASDELGLLVDAEKSVSDRLKKAGLEIAGRYSPYPGSTIIIVTNEAIKNNASRSEMGGFGAAQRISLTQVGSNVQISYTNPIYMAHAYRMKQDFSDIAKLLANTLGHQLTYGLDIGLTKQDLQNYQYKWLMPYFTDPIELAVYPSQKDAMEKIQALFSENKTGVEKVYQVDLLANNEAVIGVQLTSKQGNDCSGDQYIMSRIDFKKIKSTGHLPYEIVVSNGKVFALPAEFRIAINFPDLSMMGSNSFASIMCAPGSIQAALTSAVGGEEEN